MANKSDISVTLSGFKELDALLKALPDRVVMTAVRQASNNAMTPMTKSCKRQAVKVSKTYAKAMGKNQKTYRKDGTVFTVVGARKGFKSDGGHNPVNTAHLMEFGTKPHALGSGSSNRERGKVKIDQHGAMHPGAPAYNILKRGFDSTEPQSKAIFKRDFHQKLITQATKLASEKGTLKGKRN